jgi:branched-subunit amino acid transport protein
VSSAWAAVLLVGGATVAIKGAGPVFLGGKQFPARVNAVIALLAPTLLAALVVTQAFAHGRGLVLDARGAGLAAAGLAIALRAPVLVVVVAACAAAALVRALT